MSDITQENARQPMQPWQYILVVIAAVGTIVLLWFFLRNTQLWHSETPKPVERSSSGPAPMFVGAPDIQETAAQNSPPYSNGYMIFTCTPRNPFVESVH